MLSLLILSLFFFSNLSADHFEQLFSQGIKVDLREPHFSEGVLSTEKGGVITAPDMRIQAQKIEYTRKTVEGKSICTLVAEGDLIVEFGHYLFVGSRLEFDFQTRRGLISDGRSSVEPWFFGGKSIELCPDGTYVILDGYITTSENIDPDWQISIHEATITQDLELTARKIAFSVEDIPIFQWPTYSMNLSEIGESPLSYTVRWGGHQGPRLGITYEAISWKRFTTFLRLDYRLNRGPGFGIETDYTSEDHLQSLKTISYAAMDSSLVHPNEKFRYRLQGVYCNKQFGDGFSADLLWDKLSDKYMATDYYDKGLELDTAQRTQLHVRHEHPNTITNFFVKIKANSFQTVKEELPTLQNNWRPINLYETGIIVNTQAKASYLDFRYANFLMRV
ncbi:MAG: hypothetical protein LLG04_06315, partial [Parachlamydia sp.]|nr:hypothetical protein [Parachlamydia sp.]